MAEPEVQLQAIAPEFLVNDVVRTAEWYRDNLGFEIGHYYREGEHDDERERHHDHAEGEPVFVILSRARWSCWSTEFGKAA